MIRLLIILAVGGGIIFYVYRTIKRLLPENRKPAGKSFPDRKPSDPLRHAKKANVIDIK